MPKEKKEKKQDIDLSPYKISNKDDFFKMVKSNLAIGVKVHKQEAEDWDRYIKQYRMGKSTNLNVQSTDLKRDKTKKMIANYVFNIIQTIIAATHDKRAEVSLLPRGADDEGEKTETAQALLDYDFDRLKIYEKVDEFVYLDSLLTGQGYIKMPWVFESEIQEKTRTVVKTKKKGIIRRREVEVEEEEKYDEENPITDDPDVLVINPYRLIRMPDADTLQESEWVFEEIPMKKDIADEEFGENLVADYDIEMYKQWRKDSEVIRDDEVKRVKIYEGWGKVLGKDGKIKKVMITFTSKKLLRVEPNPYHHGMCPYVELPNYKDFHSAYNMAEVKQIERLQNELDRNRQTIAEANKKMVNPQRRVEKGSVDAKGLQQLRDPRAGVLVEVKAGKMSGIQDVTPNPLGKDVYQFDGIIKEDMARASGINDYESGGNERRVESATGVAIMSEATQRRIREKVRGLERFYEQAAEMLIALYKQFGDRERTLRITGDKSAKPKKFTPQEILGEYDFVAEGGSTMPVNREARSARWLKVYEIFKDNEFIDQQKLSEKAFKESADLKDVDKYMVTEETPPEAQAPPAMPPELPGMPPMGMPPPPMAPMPPPMGGVPASPSQMGGMMGGAGIPPPPIM